MEEIFEILKTDFIYFKKHKKNFDDVVKSIKGSNDLIKIVGPLLLFTKESLNSIKILYKQNYLKDCFVLSRHYIETIINIGFICATKETSIKKSYSYSIQRSFRDKNRELKINSKQHKLIYGNEKFLKELAQNEIIKQSLKEYTTNRGKEITQWTKETIKEKIEIIDKKYDDYVSDLLTFAFFSIYKDSSEVIHGSYYGFLLFSGLEDKSINSFNTADEFIQHITKHQIESMKLLFLILSISIVSIIIILQKEFNLEYDINKCKELLNEQATQIKK